MQFLFVEVAGTPHELEVQVAGTSRDQQLELPRDFLVLTMGDTQNP